MVSYQALAWGLPWLAEFIDVCCERRERNFTDLVQALATFWGRRQKVADIKSGNQRAAGVDIKYEEVGRRQLQAITGGDVRQYMCCPVINIGISGLTVDHLPDRALGI